LNAYCTYFDRRFLIQGLALATSLRAHDPSAMLWVLCLDEFTHAYLREAGHENIRAVALAELEGYDPALRAVKKKRTRIDYYFTLSPCWPRYLLHTHPEFERVTYVDADMAFFASPEAIFSEMAQRSVYITEHRYPPHLAHHRRFGLFNVGILSFRNDRAGHECLTQWRRQCLRWCHDTAEDGRYADQGYLDAWPALLGDKLCVSQHPGVNLAPWNWQTQRVTTRADRVAIGGQPLVVFHFARFRPLYGTWLFQSGQLEYGIMPASLRRAIYSPYWRLLSSALKEIRRLRPDFDFPKSTARGWHAAWKSLGPRVFFGSDWLRLGSGFFSGRLGIGQFSGRVLNRLRLLREKPEPVVNTPSPFPATTTSAPSAKTAAIPGGIPTDSIAPFPTPHSNAPFATTGDSAPPFRPGDDLARSALR
jgi:hypothetical protein